MKITAQDIIIKGVTLEGQAFRPGDWADRLSSVLYSLDRGNRMGFLSCVQPVGLEGVKCVVVSKRLASLDPQAYRFLTEFARDNDLQVEDGENWVKTHPEAGPT
ncbi:MAG: DUF3579 domain-containing protein [Burkholderiales bacterium]|nr:DUF3579 domain-containing protein [Burkholderiales bacterium]